VIRALVASLLVAGTACGARPGDACSDDGACDSPDLVCMKPAADAGTGVCTFTFQGLGARCLSNADCAPGTFCSNDLSAGDRQFAGQCTAQQGAGSPCFRNADCASPLRCGGSDGGLGTCG
jgi:hypothetical protein